MTNAKIDWSTAPAWATKAGFIRSGDGSVFGIAWFGCPEPATDANESWYFVTGKSASYYRRVSSVITAGDLIEDIVRRPTERGLTRQYNITYLKTEVRSAHGRTKRYGFGAGTLTVYPDGKAEYVTQHPLWEYGSERADNKFAVVPGYESLHNVLSRAFDQAAKGKGKERHAGDLPFDEQPMQQISDLLNNDAGMAFQACKKIHEARGLSHEAKIRELLGAINYIAGMVIWHERHHQCAEAPTQKS